MAEVPDIFDQLGAGFVFMPPGVKFPPMEKGWEKKPHTFAEAKAHLGNVGVLAGNGFIGLDKDNPSAFEGLELPTTTLWETRPGRLGMWLRCTEGIAEGLATIGKPSNQSQLKLFKDGKAVGEVKLQRTYQVIPPSHKYIDPVTSKDVLPGRGIRVDYKMLDSSLPAEISLEWLLSELQRLGITFSSKPGSIDTKALQKHGERDDALTRGYAKAALRSEAETLAGTTQGDRNNQLFKSAANMGEFVAAGALSEDEVIASLVLAADGTGLDREEIKKTLQSGLDKGKQHPRKIPKPEKPKPKGSTVGSIQINDRHLQDVTAECMAALVANNDPPQIFSRSGSLIRLHHDAIQPLSVEALKNALADATGFHISSISADGEEIETDVSPPTEVCKAVLALSDWPGIPEIKSLIEIPVIRPDGSILSVPGYDEATQLYLIPIVDLSEVIIPDELSQKHAEASARYIQEELFSDFPFSDEASKANMLALMLSVIVRPMIAGNIPLTILDKPQAGMGASLIADIVATVATGRPASMWGAPETEDEWRKAITSALLSGSQVIVIDNVVRRLNSASLTRALTAKIWRDRLLGKSHMLDLPQGAVWIVTGNNIQIGGDLGRRSTWIRFTSTCSRPWTRTGFKHPDILGWVKENHASVISNLLIMARAWAQAGCLDGTARLGGFNEWAKVISGILEFAGVKDFMGNAAQMYDEMDQDVQQWDAFLGEWITIHANSPVSSGQLIDELLSFEPIYRPFQEAMPDDVATAVSRDRRASHSLGHALRKHLNQVYPSGRMLTGEIDAHSNSMKWMVCGIAGIKKESRNCNPQHQTVLGEVAGSAGSVPCGSDFPEISDTRKCAHAPTHVDRVGTLPADPAELFDDAVRCGSSGGVAGIAKRIPQNRGKNLVCAKCGEDLTEKSSVEKNGKTYCTQVDCGFPARGSA